MRIEEQAVDLKDLSSLECGFALLRVSGFETLPEVSILRGAFAGTFRHGAAGNEDGDFMLAQLRAGLTAWRPHALLIDLTRLDYEWGEALIEPLSVNRSSPWRERSLPLVALSSIRCERGLVSLVEEVGGFDAGYLVATSQSKAIGKLMKRVQKFRKGLGWQE